MEKGNAKQEILEAALDLFSVQGFEATSFAFAFFKGKTIVNVLNMSVEEALPFFANNKKICAMLDALMEVGLSYISLGQPLSTFSGGERQRVKLAQNIKKKENIYMLDEPTTGLHPADIEKVCLMLCMRSYRFQDLKRINKQIPVCQTLLMHFLI